MSLKFVLSNLFFLCALLNYKFEFRLSEHTHSKIFAKRSFDINFNKTISQGKNLLFNLLHKQVGEKLRIKDSNQRIQQPKANKQLKLNRICLGNVCMDDKEINSFYNAQDDLKKKEEKEKIERVKLYENFKNDYWLKFLLDFNVHRYF